MVIAVASLALAVDTAGRTVRCALGSVGPVPLRARAAESWLAEQVDWDRGRPAVADPAAFGHFGALVAEAARPIDDHRSTADYRRHAVRVLAERAAIRALA
jgi:CO/xanthine dehydrogenase FAD-binding subunit